MNRVRVRFGRGEELKFISHLDLTRLWHRALRRAGIALAYSEGFNPHPRISLAAPLQIGVTSEGELMDVYTVQPVTPSDFTSLLGAEIPVGLSLLRVFNVPLNIPSLQSQVSFADYDVDVMTPEGYDIGQAILNLMKSASIPWCHRRDTGARDYDLRPLVISLNLACRKDNVANIKMRLRSGAGGTGRPEQVIMALGLDNPLSIHRTGLILEIRNA